MMALTTTVNFPTVRSGTIAPIRQAVFIT
jgi:hypothetical protein